MATQPVALLTEEEYLRIEQSAKFKSEFVGGKMFAMAGGTMRHARLTARTQAQLEDQLEGTHCRSFSSDARVLTPDTGDQFYPDVSVVCGPTVTHAGSSDIMTNPVLLVEVLSPSTADYDRGLKFELYRQIPTLRDYLAIHCKSVFVEHWSRQSDGTWNPREYRGVDASIPLPNIGCELHLRKLYQGVMDEPD